MLSLGLPMEGDRVAEKATRVHRLLHHQESGVQVEGEGDPAASSHHQDQGAEHPARIAGRAAGAGAHGCEHPSRAKTQEGSTPGVVNGSPAPGAARGHPSPQRRCARSPRQFLALVRVNFTSALGWRFSNPLSRSVDLLSRWSGGQVTVPDSRHPVPYLDGPSRAPLAVLALWIPAK